MNNEERYYEENSISFSDMWHNFIDHIVTVAIIVFVCLASFLSLAVLKGKTYSSSAVINVSKGGNDNSINVKKELMQVLINDDVLNRVSKELNIEKNSIKDCFSLYSDDKSTKITITYTTKNNDKVVEIVNSFARNAILEFDAINEDGSMVHDKFYDATEIFSEASNVVVSSKTKKYFAFGTLLGLMFGGMYVLTITMMDNHFKNRKEVEYLNIPLLGEVKSYKEDK